MAGQLISKLIIFLILITIVKKLKAIIILIENYLLKIETNLIATEFPHPLKSQ